MPGQPRPLLCWNSQLPTGAWEKSFDNQFWRPSLTNYPDTRLLEAGDILLVQPLIPTAMQRMIQLYEGGTFTHAAVYLQSDHLICEASAKEKKVVFSNLETLLEGNCILVRRVRDMDKRAGDRIAEMAVSLLSRPYGFQIVIEAVIQRLARKRPGLATDHVEEQVICSSLCEHAIMAATEGRVRLTRRAGELIMPEDLAATPALQDLDISWKVVI